MMLETLLLLLLLLYVRPLQLLNQATDFHEIQYGRCAIRYHANIVLFNFLQSVTTVRLTHKLARWGQHRHHFNYATETTRIHGNLFFKICNFLM
jgi:hypothetical protein